MTYTIRSTYQKEERKLVASPQLYRMLHLQITCLNGPPVCELSYHCCPWYPCNKNSSRIILTLPSTPLSLSLFLLAPSLSLSLSPLLLGLFLICNERLELRGSKWEWKGEIQRERGRVRDKDRSSETESESVRRGTVKRSLSERSYQGDVDLFETSDRSFCCQCRVYESLDVYLSLCWHG